MQLKVIILLHIEEGINKFSTMEVLSVSVANNITEALVKMAVANSNRDITYVHNKRPEFLCL